MDIVACFNSEERCVEVRDHWTVGNLAGAVRHAFDWPADTVFELAVRGDDGQTQVPLIDDATPLCDIAVLGLEPRVYVIYGRRLTRRLSLPKARSALMKQVTLSTHLLALCSKPETHDTLEMADVILEAASLDDIQIVGVGTKSCVLSATAAGNLETLRLLRQYGSDVAGERGPGMRSVLHIAASRGHAELLDEFRLWGDFGEGVLSCADSRGFTPLHCAAFHGEVACIDALVGWGARLEATGPFGTPFDTAIRGNQCLAMQCLRNSGARIDLAQHLAAAEERGAANAAALLTAWGAGRVTLDPAVVVAVPAQAEVPPAS